MIELGLPDDNRPSGSCHPQRAAEGGPLAPNDIQRVIVLRASSLSIRCEHESYLFYLLPSMLTIVRIHCFVSWSQMADTVKSGVRSRG